MDFYQMLFGRPAPGRRAEPTVLNYLREPERHREVTRAGELPDEVRRAARGDAPLPDAMRDARNELARRERGVAGTPFSAATGTDLRPFGDDFATYSDAVEAASRPPLPDVLAVRPAMREPTANEGREARNANNEPLGIEGGTRRIPTRVERGVNDRAPTEEVYFPPIPRDREAERRAGIRYPEEFDVNREWMDAEERAAERWRRREPTAADRFFAAIYGHRRFDRARRDHVTEDARRLREETRRRRPTEPEPLPEDRR